jgi:hypothetical protein
MEPTKIELTFQRPQSADSYSFSIDGIDDEEHQQHTSEPNEEKKQDSRVGVPSKKNRNRRSRPKGTKTS